MHLADKRANFRHPVFVPCLQKWLNTQIGIQICPCLSPCDEQVQLLIPDMKLLFKAQEKPVLVDAFRAVGRVAPWDFSPFASELVLPQLVLPQIRDRDQ